MFSRPDFSAYVTKQWLLVVFLAIYACSNKLPELDLRVNRGSVDLSRQVPGDWDRVCILTPHTSRATAAKKTGLPVLEMSETGITVGDAFNILLFARGKQIFAAYRVSRNNIDFAYSEPRCFPKAAAELAVRQ